MYFTAASYDLIPSDKLTMRVTYRDIACSTAQSPTRLKTSARNSIVLEGG